MADLVIGSARVAGGSVSYGDVPDEGYRSLVDAMAVGFDLRLGVEMAEVALSADGVRVRVLTARPKKART